MSFAVIISAFAIAFGLLYFFLWVNTIKNAIQNESLGSGEKLGWVLAMIFFPFLELYFIGFYWKNQREFPKEITAKAI